jgi:hypothetical protein
MVGARGSVMETKSLQARDITPAIRGGVVAGGEVNGERCKQCQH